MTVIATITTTSRARKVRPAETVESLVDELGSLKARIAEIEDQAKPLAARAEEIRKALIASGRTEIDGALYRATVSTAERSTLDTAAIKASVPAEWLARFSKVATVTTVRVVARLAGRA